MANGKCETKNFRVMHQKLKELGRWRMFGVEFAQDFEEANEKLLLMTVLLLSELWNHHFQAVWWQEEPGELVSEPCN